MNGRSKLHMGAANDGKLLQVVHVVNKKEKNARELAEEEEKERRLEQLRKNTLENHNIRKRKGSQANIDKDDSKRDSTSKGKANSQSSKSAGGLSTKTTIVKPETDDFDHPFQSEIDGYHDML